MTCAFGYPQWSLTPSSHIEMSKLEEKCTVHKELEACTKCEKSIKRVKNLEEQLAKCNLRIATHESNEELMQELKNKAEFFQKYILDRFQKIQDQRHVATNTETELTSTKEMTDNKTDREEKDENDTKKPKSSENDDLVRRTDLMLKEKEIREQIAEKFTFEMKAVELNYTKKLKELESDTGQTITKLKHLLEQKADEVETLKKFILTERSKISEILDAKENEISALIKENNSLQEDYQELRAKTDELKNALEKAQGKLNKLKNELEKKGGEVMSEREKSDRIKTELTQQQQILESKVGQLEAQYDLLKEKYRNVKKTALVYKDYASKKDEHVASELDRIKSHYQGLLTQMQEQLHTMVQKRQQQEVTERINKIQSNFNAVISEGGSSQNS
ncbi:hypothetical protein EVAR_4287_1 [Eumeta japonica]|uniref:Uncharacterized protein n=1 Tax=Eumeta variegata TaxID=151549 RepID=A0A4C1VBZ3_EUMVA|nr:hypothetical protein EVAR_4287_1 [Eumeta japonica]